MVVEPPDGVLEPLFRIDPGFWHQGVVDTAFPVLLPECCENQLLDIRRALEPFDDDSANPESAIGESGLAVVRARAAGAVFRGLHAHVGTFFAIVNLAM
jgi:hypothetical protein